nr:hypothetical protein [Tanacetum cinerariifolium]
MLFIRNRRQANRPTRTTIYRDCYGAHDRLVAAFFSENQMYDAYKFRKTFQMARPLFNWIVDEVTHHSSYFRDNIDCTKKEGISSLLKLEYLRKPMVTDVVKLYRHYKEKHDFSGCKEALIVRIGSGLLSLLRRKTYGYDMFFGGDGSNNDINVLYQSPLFNDLKTGRAPEILFVANGVTYPWGYNLVDEIYPELVTLDKTILEPAGDDNKRILYKIKQVSVRKDVD